MTLPRNMARTCIFPNCRAGTSVKDHFCDRHAIYRKIEPDLLETGGDPMQPFLATTIPAVYVMGSTHVGAIKIGIAGDVLSRLAQIQTGFPRRLSLYGAMFTSRAYAEAIESESHRVLTECGFHLSGEWFDVDPGDACSVVVKCAANLGLPILGCSEYVAMLQLDEMPAVAGASNVEATFSRVRDDFAQDIVDKQ